LGDLGNPVVIGFTIVDVSPETAAARDTLAVQLAAGTGYAVVSQTYENYTQLLDALADGEVHMAWLPPLTYIIANRRGLADVALISNHYGVYAYGTLVLTNLNQGYATYYDPATNKGTADALTALQQFAGRRPCFVEETSIAGYVLPLGYLKANGINIEDPVIAQTHQAVVRSLYTGGICDFGATFGTYGDPRTSSAVQETLPDVMNHVVVTWQSDAVIPNWALAYHVVVSPAMRQKLNEALIILKGRPGGLGMLSDANMYQIADLKPVDNTFYDALNYYVDASQVPVYTLVGR
jgi:phosphonate transport system substrate-binding protein